MKRNYVPKILGIIAEYNPFHSGHLYQINTAKSLCAADYVVVIMSGHFTQRGDPAIYDPYSRCGCSIRDAGGFFHCVGCGLCILCY